MLRCTVRAVAMVAAWVVMKGVVASLVVYAVCDGIFCFRSLSRNRDREVHKSIDMSSGTHVLFGTTDVVSEAMWVCLSGTTSVDRPQ